MNKLEQGPFSGHNTTLQRASSNIIVSEPHSLMISLFYWMYTYFNNQLLYYTVYTVLLIKKKQSKQTYKLKNYDRFHDLCDKDNLFHIRGHLQYSILFPALDIFTLSIWSLSIWVRLMVVEWGQGCHPISAQTIFFPYIGLKTKLRWKFFRLFHHCCQLFAELFGQTRRKILPLRKKIRPPVLFPFWRNLGIRETFLLKFGPFSAFFVQNRSKLGPYIVRPLHFLFGYFLLMQLNNRPVGNTVYHFQRGQRQKKHNLNDTRELGRDFEN